MKNMTILSLKCKKIEVNDEKSVKSEQQGSLNKRSEPSADLKEERPKLVK